MVKAVQQLIKLKYYSKHNNPRSSLKISVVDSEQFCSIYQDAMTLSIKFHIEVLDLFFNYIVRALMVFLKNIPFLAWIRIRI